MARRTRQIAKDGTNDNVLNHVSRLYADKKFTVKEQRFCEEYVIDWNASRAARAAGYSENEVAARAVSLLRNPRIKAQIAKIKDKLSELSGVTALRNIIELRKIAYGNAAQFYTDWDKMKPWNQLTADEKAAISEIKTETMTRNGKGGKVIIKNKQVKLQDKIKAIDVLNKMLGFNAAEEKRHTVTSDGSLQIALTEIPLDDLSDEELKLLQKLSKRITKRNTDEE